MYAAISLFHSFPTVLITVGYELKVYTAFETQGMVELSVIIFDPPSGGAPQPFTLSVSTEESTAGIYMHVFIEHIATCTCSREYLLYVMCTIFIHL